MRVLVVFGGRSGEHEVSVISARRVVEGLVANSHEPVCVGITRSGRWVEFDPHAGPQVSEDAPVFALDAGSSGDRGFELAFPVLHGPFGEDGCIQGLFEMADIAYVGSDVQGCAVGMDKVLHKSLLAAAGLPVVDFTSFVASEWRTDPDAVKRRVSELGLPVFVKPSHLGSSVGISKVDSLDELSGAVERALIHDDLVLVEARGGSRELEVGVLEGPAVSVVGEIITRNGFYDYKTKYLDDAGAEIVVPADLPQDVATEAQLLAAKVFKVAGASGLARVDLFYDDARGLLQVNEINSMPGMTPASMFPMVWEASGMAWADVVQMLLDHAIERHGRRADRESARLAAHAAEIGADLTGERSGR